MVLNVTISFRNYSNDDLVLLLLFIVLIIIIIINNNGESIWNPFAYLFKCIILF